MGAPFGGIVLGRLPDTPRQPSARMGPDPSYLDTIGSSFRAGRDDQPGHFEEEVMNAYGPLVTTLSDIGHPVSRYVSTARSGVQPVNEAAVWADIAAERARNPAAFKGLPADSDAFRAQVLTSTKARMAQDVDTVQRSSTAPWLVGGFGAGLTDPFNVGAMMLSGGASAAPTTLLRGMGREALVNGVVEAIEQPGVAAERAKTGRTLTMGEAAANIAAAAGIGAVFHAGVHYGAPALRATLGAVWDRLPPAVRNRWQSPDAVTDADLPDLAESVIGHGNMTQAQADAANVLRRQGEIDAANPFEPNGAGVAAHQSLLQAHLDAILASPDARSSPAQLRTGTALASGTMGAPPAAGLSAIERIETGGGSEAARQAMVSPKGAVGVMQVMPGTAPEAAKLAGLPWDEARYRTDPEYNRAIGQAYFNKQLDDFGGDSAKAAAAYNAGAGRVRAAIAAADKAGDAWEAHLPPETRAYVAKFRDRAGVSEPAARDDAGEAAYREQLYGEIQGLHADTAAPAPLPDAGDVVDAQLAETAPSTVDPVDTAAADVPRETISDVPRQRVQSIGPKDVLRVIAENGGLRDDEGHALTKSGTNAAKGDRPVSPSMVRDWGRKLVPGVGPLVRLKSGMSIDAAGELLHEAGFFTARPTESDVLDLVERAVRGERIYPPHDMPAESARPGTGAMVRRGANWFSEGELEYAHSDLLDQNVHPDAIDEELIADVAGLKVQGMSNEDAVHLAIDYRLRNNAVMVHGLTGDALDHEWVSSLAHDHGPESGGAAHAAAGGGEPGNRSGGAGGSPADLAAGRSVDLAALDHEFDDPGYLESLARQFDDITNPAAEALIESLEHDLQLDPTGAYRLDPEGGEISGKQLLDSFDEEAGDIDGLRACLPPPKSAGGT